MTRVSVGTQGRGSAGEADVKDEEDLGGEITERPVGVLSDDTRDVECSRIRGEYHGSSGCEVAAPSHELQ